MHALMSSDELHLNQLFFLKKHNVTHFFKRSKKYSLYFSIRKLTKHASLQRIRDVLEGGLTDTPVLFLKESSPEKPM